MDAVVPAEDLGWVGMAETAQIGAGVAVVGMAVGTEAEVVDMCERMKARDDACSEAADGPIRWDSKTEGLPSASALVDDAPSGPLPRAVTEGQTCKATMLGVVVAGVVQAPRGESLVK